MTDKTNSEAVSEAASRPPKLSEDDVRILQMAMVVGVVKLASYMCMHMSGKEFDSEFRQLGADLSILGNGLLISMASYQLLRLRFPEHKKIDSSLSAYPLSSTQTSMLHALEVARYYLPDAAKGKLKNILAALDEITTDPILTASLFTMATGLCLAYSGHDTGRDAEFVRGIGQASAHFMILAGGLFSVLATHKEGNNAAKNYIGTYLPTGDSWPEIRARVRSVVCSNPRYKAAAALAGMAAIDGAMAMQHEGDMWALMSAGLLVVGNLMLGKTAKPLLPSQAVATLEAAVPSVGVPRARITGD